MLAPQLAKDWVYLALDLAYRKPRAAGAAIGPIDRRANMAPTVWIAELGNTCPTKTN
jgi:hypothetical protein